ncbi:MAG: PD-(D/E)XK motif protein [Deltaproteobacteria bacterium]|nr:MAG: PD-(D/E)XK motif protein [Deltaproteobacteria bacterium]
MRPLRPKSAHRWRWPVSTPDVSDDFPSQLWTLLRASPSESGPLELPSIATNVRVGGEHVRMALGSHGEPRVLLPLDPKRTPRRLDAGAAIDWHVRKLGSRTKGTLFLDLGCKSPALEEVFAELVQSIVRRVGSGLDSVDATTAVLREFRELLVPKPQEAVDRTTIAGLLGELLVLKQLLRISADGWRSWLGADGDRHDFVNAANALEVKASTRSSTSHVQIHGIEQLEPPRDGTLHLLHVRLDADPAGPVALAALVDEVLALASDPGAIRNALNTQGCTDPHDVNWNRHRFRLHSWNLYAVNEGFPRLAPSILASRACPPGVSAVSYRLDLALAGDFLRAESELQALMKRLCA